MDEAEQVYLSQWLLPNYAHRAGQLPQPPLYQWIQIGFFRTFGLNVLALTLLKNLILCLTYALAFLAAHALTRNPRLSILASLSLFSIPQITWGFQRDQTHAVLATMMSVAVFHAAVRLVQTPSLTWSIAFGGFVGLGVMSKYNFAIFACALVLALAVARTTRRIILSRYGAFSLAAFALVILPQVGWWLSHTEMVDAIGGNLQRMEAWSPIGSTVRIFWAAINFLAIPVLVMFLVGLASRFLFNSPLRLRRLDFPLARIAAWALCLHLVVGIALNTAMVPDRWLTPSFWIVPFFFVILLEPETLPPRLWRHLLWATAIAAIVVLTVSVFSVRGLWATELLKPHARHVGMRLIIDHPKRNYPFDVAARAGANAGCERGWIVTDDAYFAGNLRLQFPESVVVVPSWIPGSLRSLSEEDSLLVIWNSRDSHEMPTTLRDWVDSAAGIDLRAAQVVRIEAPYAYSLRLTAKIGFVCLPSIREARAGL